MPAPSLPPLGFGQYARERRTAYPAAVLPDPRGERRRRLAEPDLEFRAFCARRRSRA